jgi:hypothetical protein
VYCILFERVLLLLLLVSVLRRIAQQASDHLYLQAVNENGNQAGRTYETWQCIGQKAWTVAPTKASTALTINHFSCRVDHGTAVGTHLVGLGFWGQPYLSVHSNPLCNMSLVRWRSAAAISKLG